MDTPLLPIINTYDDAIIKEAFWGIQPKTLEKYRLAVRGFYVKNEWLMGSH